ncbi:OLC1v1013439C1 [Oldenlandia corymbosa var. corymbosa]|uniref:DNA-directed DNA polymerase n=1 Tax=Oldenlandia corymbosa var. corymbosa TaxID=529605 RepID=A0AAV1DYA9_OLDCO|nr:OLC1v1013439C1 [Oldenlandia corymbosa var. corymbosa]
MMDGRRHSVDVPISRTLVALRRVRSLRDPSTNSLSKFSPLLENLNWETNSNNGITLGFERKYNDCVDIGNDLLGFRDKKLDSIRGQHGNDQDQYGNGRKSTSKLKSHELSCFNENEGSAPSRNVHVEESNIAQPSLDLFCGGKSLSERYGSSYRDKGLELACMTPLEGVGSCNEQNDGSTCLENIDFNVGSKQCQYNRKQTRSGKPAAGDFLSRVGSPCLSVSDALLRGSSHASLNGNNDTDSLDFSQCGCGISRCWSRSTPRFRESQYQLDAEDHPLLPGGVVDTPISEHRRGCKHANNGTCFCSESPRSLGQKFRPKSFSELVGQNVVVKSLLSAISSRRISSFYLFHGPRGTGKTSAARIFAAALNCVSPDVAKPCGQCRDCVLFFSGKGRDIKEVDSLKVNGTQRIRAIIKNAENSPCSSRFKVVIIDECHLLQEDSWATFLNNLEELSRHVVFIMITPDLHKLPRSAVSRSQRYQFTKLKEADVAGQLEKICMEEGFDFDRNALEFIASKSSGSLRDAEMMLEQSSLIGKKITMSLVYELMGVVSDEELLDLLHLALSSNTSDTVKRARELMRSRIDPLQLISQLANIIMDILAGKCQGEASEVQRRLFGRSISEADMQQLSQALKILSETEKQLRMSKSQTTWLTVALLQLSSVGASVETNESRFGVKSMQLNEGEFYSTSSTSESLKHPVSCTCNNNACKIGIPGQTQTMESVWRRAVAVCESSSLKHFLQKHGKLLTVRLRQGLAVAELGFYNAKYVAKAEKQWKAIAGGLQHVLGHNVEIRINLVIDVNAQNTAKVKKPAFRLFSCSRRSHHRSCSGTECESDPSDKSDFSSTKAFTRDKYIETGSSESGSHSSHACCLNKEMVRTIRSSNGNALSIALTTPKHQNGVEHLKYGSCDSQDICASEREKQPGCFPRTLKLQKLKGSNATEMAFCRSCLEKNQTSLVPEILPQTYSHATDPGVPCCGADNY